MISTKQRLGIAGAVGGAVLGAAAIGGVVLAQTGPGSTPSQSQPAQNGQALADQFLNDLAAYFKMDPATFKSGVQAVAKTEVAKEVAAGRLTAAQGQQADAAIDAGKLPIGGFGQHRGGPGGPGGPLAALAGQRQALQQAVEGVLSQDLGVNNLTDLRTQLKNGATLDQLAQQHSHKTVQDVRNDLAAAVKKVLDPLVPGTITQQQETDILAAITSGQGNGLGVLGFLDGTRGPRGQSQNGSRNGNGGRSQSGSQGGGQTQ